MCKLFSVLVAIIALSLGVLGEDYSASSGPWCWIKDCDTIPINPVFWMFITGKAWEIVAYVGTFTIYMLLKADRWNRLKRVNLETILYNLLFMLMKKTKHFFTTFIGSWYNYLTEQKTSTIIKWSTRTVIWSYSFTRKFFKSRFCHWRKIWLTVDIPLPVPNARLGYYKVLYFRCSQRFPVFAICEQSW